MNAEHLIQMANRIGQFFESMPDHAEALEGIASHIRKFWEPRMRHEFKALLDDPAQTTIRPIVREALGRHPATLV